MIPIKLKKTNPDAVIPQFKTKGSAGADLYASEECYIRSGTTKLVKTGISLAIPEGYCGLVQGRSGLSLKGNYHVKTGTIDSDYRGEIGVIMSNPCTSHMPLHIAKGDRIAQILFMPIKQAQFIEIDELDETERGSGGFGSTGIRDHHCGSCGYWHSVEGSTTGFCSMLETDKYPDEQACKSFKLA
jgi:dUTP pyrophosphatase